MQTNAPSLGSVTLTFTLYYIGVSIVLAIILWALQTYAGFSSESNAFSWLPLILAAMFAGQSYGAKAGGKPPQSFSWIAGLIFTIVSILVGIAFVYAVGAAMGIDMTVSLSQLRAEMGDDAALIFGLIGGAMIIVWVAIRFTFSMGAAQGARVQAAKAAK